MTIQSEWFIQNLFSNCPFIMSIDNQNIYITKGHNQYKINHEQYRINNTKLHDMIKDLRDKYMRL